MKPIAYEFEKLNFHKRNHYIFQLVKGRKLTSVYHTHDFYEAIWFVRGNGTHMINDTEIPCYALHDTCVNAYCQLRFKALTAIPHRRGRTALCAFLPASPNGSPDVRAPAERNRLSGGIPEA